MRSQQRFVCHHVRAIIRNAARERLKWRWERLDRDGNGGAVAQRAVDGDIAAGALDGALGNRQAQSPVPAISPR